MSNLFEVGDRVRVIRNGCGCDSGEVGAVVTVTELGGYVDGLGVKVSPPIGNSKGGEHEGFIGVESFELVEPCSQGQRGELEHAIDVFDRHNIRRSYDDDYRIRGESIWYNKEQLLNRLFPVGNPAIEEIEAEMRTLADRLRELKNERP